MKLFNTVLLVTIAVLSVAAGAAKLMQAPQELEFLQNVGLDTLEILFFGALQSAGGLLLLIPRTRVFGAVLVTLGFAVSVILLFIADDRMFALISIIPFALSLFILSQARLAAVQTK